ncbi:MAG: cysteine dioxygenase family protein [Planctomycetota bacterium]|nr:cysteine dioxygenase family protein [Planctomycetota bacterium]
MTRDAPASRPRPCSDPRYGLAPGGHASLSAWATQVEAILATTAPDDIPERVSDTLIPLLARSDLLLPAQRETGSTRYRKHCLYADPDGRFTLLALIWLPGQGTVVHGHTAWCSVGVFEGRATVVCYDCRETADGTHEADETSHTEHGPGARCAVRPGLGDVHRIYNGTGETMITLHAYGCDLVENPDAINLYVTLSS